MSRLMLGIAVRLGAVCLAFGFITYAFVMERAENAQDKEIEPRSGPTVEERRPPIYDLEWSATGARLLAVRKDCEGRGNALLFDLSTKLYDGIALPIPVAVRRAVFEPGTDAVLAGTDYGHLWQANIAQETAIKLGEIPSASTGLSSMRVIGDERVVGTQFDVRMIDSVGQTRWVLPDAPCVRHIAVSVDRKHLIMPMPVGKTLIVSTQTGRVEWTLKGACAACPAVLPDGRGVVISNAKSLISLWNLETGEKTWEMQHDCPAVASLTATPDGHVVVGNWLGELVLISPHGREVRRIQAHRGVVSSLGVSADGRTLASGGYDGKIFLWNPQSLERIDQIQ